MKMSTCRRQGRDPIYKAVAVFWFWFWFRHWLWLWLLGGHVTICQSCEKTWKVWCIFVRHWTQRWQRCNWTAQKLQKRLRWQNRSFGAVTSGRTKCPVQKYVWPISDQLPPFRFKHGEFCAEETYFWPVKSVHDNKKRHDEKHQKFLNKPNATYRENARRTRKCRQPSRGREIYR